MSKRRIRFRRPNAMTPSPWPVPPLPTSAQLAEWLGITIPELDWFADCKRLLCKSAARLQHYTYRRLAKRSGAARLLEMPKQRLKAIQRRILHEILDHIPPHEAAHGFRRGRSIATFAAEHVGRRIVLRFDLRDFFPSIRASRVHALVLKAGYPRPVTRLLTGLCTTVASCEVAPAYEVYRTPHVPQGAPTSPALANLCAYRLDCRMAGLARKVGAHYTRYADDLAFSGDEALERCARRFQIAVCRIALEEGFEVHTQKSRFMRQSVRQQLGGVVVNARPNVRRTEYETLKAILCNCVRQGAASQNRAGVADFRGHLLGRIAYVAMLNPTRGAKLRAKFSHISWNSSETRGFSVH
jgi:hypothetical protein